MALDMPSPAPGRQSRTTRVRVEVPSCDTEVATALLEAEGLRVCKEEASPEGPDHKVLDVLVPYEGLSREVHAYVSRRMSNVLGAVGMHHRVRMVATRPLPHPRVVSTYAVRARRASPPWWARPVPTVLRRLAPESARTQWRHLVQSRSLGAQVYGADEDQARRELPSFARTAGIPVADLRLQFIRSFDPAHNMSLPPQVRSPQQAGLCSSLLLAIAVLVTFAPAGANTRLLTAAIGAVAVVAAAAATVFQPFVGRRRDNFVLAVAGVFLAVILGRLTRGFLQVDTAVLVVAGVIIAIAVVPLLYRTHAPWFVQVVLPTLFVAGGPLMVFYSQFLYGEFLSTWNLQAEDVGLTNSDLIITAAPIAGYVLVAINALLLIYSAVRVFRMGRTSSVLIYVAVIVFVAQLLLQVAREVREAGDAGLELARTPAGSAPQGWRRLDPDPVCVIGADDWVKGVPRDRPMWRLGSGGGVTALLDPRRPHSTISVPDGAITLRMPTRASAGCPS
ncbi:hypothetical protein [Streptomyces sp. NPDC088246]|uniref:hypothetical protein n=1 Tax=Streptomyces sp. NPDC088246 TaxID=3365842 RepID=UPI003814FC03